MAKGSSIGYGSKWPMLNERPVFPVIISAASGTGKTTVVNQLVRRKPNRFHASVSSTTRAPRGKERQGVEYHFVTKEEFLRLIETGMLYEWAFVHGHYYGTPVAEVETGLKSGKVVLLDIDFQGGWQLISSLPGAVSVFLLPPSLAELERRLAGRGTEDAETMARRLRKAGEEIERGIATYDYLVINDRFEGCVDIVTSIIDAEQAKRWRLSVNLNSNNYRRRS
jgi:guanylate kinase